MVVAGPVQDFAGTVSASVSVTLLTGAFLSFDIPFDGTFTLNLRDRLSISVSVQTDIYAATYARAETCGRDTVCGVQLIDIWARHVSARHPAQLTGFDPLEPEIRPLSDEVFIGASGTEYPAPIDPVALGDLAVMLPDLDLSAFSGDPASLVYVAAGNIPPLELVPEPSFAVPLATGILLCRAIATRRKGNRFRSNRRSIRDNV